jgi:preprotein translocase subunit SecA
MEKTYDGKKNKKLGTAKNPAVVNVKTKERAKEVVTVKTKERAKDVESVFNENGWAYSIALEPDKDEDITDLEILLNPQKTKITEEKVGRNAPCPCGSGKKYKKCCGK